ncbi:ankyrin [Xylariaceae sp. FL0662B]|nr:ankyrin [Xylariaceae sp. FL0662B]
MPSILSLPLEVLYYVAQDLEDIRDLSAFSRSCRDIHHRVVSILYRRVKDDPSIMCWAADEGRLSTAQRLLEAGADPNVAWSRFSPRIVTLHLLDHIDDYSTKSLIPSQGTATESEGSSDDDMDENEDYLSMVSIDDDLSDEEDDENSEDDIDEDMDEDMDEDEDDDINDYASVGEGRSSSSIQCYWTPLHIAARWGDNEMIDLLLSYGADINAVSRGFCECVLPTEISPSVSRVEWGVPLWTPLHTAICHGHESTAKFLLSKGASTDVSPKFVGSETRRVTALHTACCSDLTSISRFLIDQGYQTNVEIEDHAGRTPMVYAYYSGSWASIDLLLEAGATLDARLGFFTLLRHACLEDRFGEALRFIELGADIHASFANQGPGSNLTPLRCCCISERSTSVRASRLPGRETCQEMFRTRLVKTLISAGIDIDATNSRGETPLMEAADSHLVEVVEILLAAGANAHLRDKAGTTALEKACASPDSSPNGSVLRMVKVLLAHMQYVFTFGALKSVCGFLRPDPEKVAVSQLLLKRLDSWVFECESGQMLLLEAVTNDNFEICDILFQNGLRHPNKNELETMIEACLEEDDPDALEYILKLPSAFEIMMTERRLYDAIEAQKTACIHFLISAGAPITYRTSTGRTCLIEASERDTPALASLLLDRGADPNELGDDGQGPLSCPVITGDVSMIKLLLNHGAKVHGNDPIIPRLSGPLDLAIFHGVTDSVIAMVSHKAYWESTEDQRNAHLRTACCASSMQTRNSSILTTLIADGKVNANKILPGLDASPLHLCVGIENYAVIRHLVRLGADVHLKLPRSELGTHQPKRLKKPLEGTTPLEWAIHAGNVHAVYCMLADTSDILFPESHTAPILDYVKAACHSHRPVIIEYLLDAGLDANFCDDKGDPFLSLLCETIQAAHSFEDATLPASDIAVLSAGCIAVLLDAGADPLKKNNEGVAPLDHLRRTMSYSGPSEFHQQVAETWTRVFIIDGTEIREREDALLTWDVAGAKIQIKK